MNQKSKAMRQAGSRWKTRSLRIEPLEERRVMATFGIPWPEPRSLSVSFPTDQAAVGAWRNVAREELDQVADRMVWQEAVLRAFQTWSIHSNINVGLVPDRGDDFGAAGLTSNDPRFGEFRVGAFPQSGVLANALPFQPTAGTWSGDLMVNSETPYFLAPLPPAGTVTVPRGIDGKPLTELYSVLLHEAGNALGLPDNNVRGSVMNGNYSGPNRTLKAADIAAIRELYGARRDIYETVTNNTRARATTITYPSGFTGDSPVGVNGSLNTQSDVDFYRFQPLAGKEKVTVRLWASGISLVKARIEVLDRNGIKIADAKAESIFDNNLQIEVGSLKDHSQLFIRVLKNTTDVFAIGDYRIELDYRPPELQPSILPPNHDADAVDESEETVDFVSVDALFSQAGIVESELGLDDTLATARPLFAAPGYLANTRYEAQASIATLSDRDLWSFRAPNVASPVLQVSVNPVGSEPGEAEVVLLNSSGDRISARTTKQPDGGMTIEVLNPTPAQTYVLFLRSAADATVPVGNYVVSASFATNSADNLREVLKGSIASDEAQAVEFRTQKTQMLQFTLSALAQSMDLGVQLSLYDNRTGDIVATLAAASGTVRKEYVWIGAGDYVWRVDRISNTLGTSGAVAFLLMADVLSDDQGPRRVDPNQPSNPFPDWETKTPPAPPPVINTQEPPFSNPWSSDSILTLVYNYYRDFLG